MIERKLSKVQIRTFVGLTQQREETQQIFREIAEAQAEQVEMLRVKYDLPEGKYQIRQEKNGDVLLFKVAKPATPVEPPAEDIPDEKPA